MVLGSILIAVRGRPKGLAPRRHVLIKGCLREFIADFTVLQTFQHSETAEVSYIIPNNSKICIYDTTFYVGDEVIKPEITETGEAQEIFVEAQAQNRAAIVSNYVGNGLTEFKLGNIPSGVTISVEVKCCFVGSRRGQNGLLFKFPLDVCTENGRKKCMMHGPPGMSSLEFDCSSRKSEIHDVSSNFNGLYDKEKCMYSMSITEKMKAVLLTVNFEKPPMDYYCFGGQYMGLSICASEMSRFKGKENNEFIFVVDCSGSMNGDRIYSAAQCLTLFIRSLLPGCYFNVYLFGSTFRKFFPESVKYDDDSFTKAIRAASNIRADLKGTNIYPVLQDIFAEEPKGAGIRQVFVITDGEVSNTDKVLACAREHRDRNRIFTLGLGEAADAGLVEGFASITGGCSEFVTKTDQFAGKVIQQLEASLSCAISNVDIQVEGHDVLEFSEKPLSPITVDGQTHVIVKSTAPFQGDETVLVTGLYGDENVDIAIQARGDSVKDDGSLARLLEVLFNYNSLQTLIHRINIAERDESLKQEIIMLSKASGLLSPFTSFSGCSTTVYRNIAKPKSPRMVERRATSRGRGGPRSGDLSSRRPVKDSIEPPPRARCCCSSRVGRSPASARSQASNIRRIDEEGPVILTGETVCARSRQGTKSLTGRTVSILPRRGPTNAMGEGTYMLTYDRVCRQQTMKGYWDDIELPPNLEMPPEIENIHGIGDEDKKHALFTILALAVLRHLFMQSYDTWKMIERKGLLWLRSLSADTDWESLVRDVTSKALT